MTSHVTVVPITRDNLLAFDDDRRIAASAHLTTFVFTRDKR